MERYDGKTRKDDIKKYILIGLGIVLLIVLYNATVYLVKRVSHPTPDITVVIASTKILDYVMADEAEAFLAPLVGDLDGNGKAVVEVIPLNMTANEGVATMQHYGADVKTDATLLDEYIHDGTYHLFILNANTYCKSTYCRELPKDLASDDSIYYVEIPGDAIFEETKMSLVNFYGCIHKDATNDEYNVMVKLLGDLKAQSRG